MNLFKGFEISFQCSKRSGLHFSLSSSGLLICYSIYIFICLLFFFFERSVSDITGSSLVSVAQPQKTNSSRQGGVGHRGRSYHRAAECEGQKSWGIQAHRTVTRHSSAQGSSEQAAFTLNRHSPAQGLHTPCRKAFY